MASIGLPKKTSSVIVPLCGHLFWVPIFEDDHTLDGCNSFMIWHLIFVSCIYVYIYISSSRLLMAEILHYRGCKQMYLNNGISDNYQPQLVISSEFWAINSISTMLLSISLPIGSMYGISTSYLLDFYGKCRQIYLDPMGYTAIPLYVLPSRPQKNHASRGPSRCAKKHWKGAFWDKENREKPMVKSVVGLQYVKTCENDGSTFAKVCQNLDFADV